MKCWARGGAGRMVGGANLYFFKKFFFVFLCFEGNYCEEGTLCPPPKANRLKKNIDTNERFQGSIRLNTTKFKGSFGMLSVSEHQ